MGDDQVVARELEQAEARLRQAREDADDAVYSASDPEDVCSAYTVCIAAAIEVGRLRARAEWITAAKETRATLAAREEARP